MEVAAFPFTTKSLYLGHTDWQYLRWQVIDTPGLLDRPLEERNTIEMTAVMAMVHLRAAVVFLLDISGTCGYTVGQQVALFHSLGELFSNRPVTVVMTKADIVRPDDLPPDERALVESMAAPNVSLTTMSTVTGEGVAEVKESVCARLRAMRAESKRTPEKLLAVQSQLTIAKPPEGLTPNIPASVFSPQGLGHPTQRQLEEEAGGPGRYVPNTDEERMLAVDEWKYDRIPEILNGQNIADFIDPDIEQKIEQLLREEEVRIAEYEAEKAAFEATKWAVAPDQEVMAAAIRERKELIKQKAQLHHTSKVNMPEVTKKRTKTAVAQKVSEFLEARGVDEETRERAVQEVLEEKPTRVPRVIEKESRDKGVPKRGAGERFDFYVKRNHVLQPKHVFSGKSGFKRDFK